MSRFYLNFWFFQLWCEACSFSKIFFDENQHFCVFLDHPYCDFSWFFRIKKDAQRNLAPNGPYESPWTPIFNHLVQFWIMSVPKQPPLKLKPVTLMLVFCRISLTNVRQNYNRLLTKLRQHLVDENPNLANIFGGREGCLLDSFELSSTKCCRSFVKVML